MGIQEPESRSQKGWEELAKDVASLYAGLRYVGRGHESIRAAAVAGMASSRFVGVLDELGRKYDAMGMGKFDGMGTASTSDSAIAEMGVEALS